MPAEETELSCGGWVGWRRVEKGVSRSGMRMCKCTEEGSTRLLRGFQGVCDCSGSWLVSSEGAGPDYMLPCAQEGVWTPDSQPGELLPPELWAGGQYFLMVTAGPLMPMPQCLISPELPAPLSFLNSCCISFGPRPCGLELRMRGALKISFPQTAHFIEVETDPERKGIAQHSQC